MFVGFNGAGKTTTLAKICDLLDKNGLSMVDLKMQGVRIEYVADAESHF